MRTDERTRREAVLAAILYTRGGHDEGTARAEAVGMIRRGFPAMGDEGLTLAEFLAFVAGVMRQEDIGRRES